MFIFFASGVTSYEVPLLLIVPFAVLLLLIALGPVLFPKWWHRNYPLVSMGLGLVVACYYFLQLGRAERYIAVGHEYVSFIVLIGSLFTISGGIHITVKGEARPSMNVLFLSCGAILANIIGTTGASMLLIRPWIRMNKYRITAFHIVMFIFIISNVAGCLTPIGDPPLFLGYLKGIPFWWTLKNCWVAWSIAIGLLLLIFYIVDSINIHKAPRDVMEKMTAHETWKFEGIHNFLFIGIILGAVLYNRSLPHFVPEVMMVGATMVSYFTTSRPIYVANEFSFEPIKEVAWLFLGIFATMVPALDYLGTHAAAIGMTNPVQFYFATGALSAFLDNAPTYLTFLSAQMGLHFLEINDSSDVLINVGNYPREVLAISLGAVFFGAMTYIGNGPNLMVKAIAAHAKVHTPGFFRYIFCYSIPILFPILVLIGFLFFSHWRIF